MSIPAHHKILMYNEWVISFEHYVSNAAFEILI